MKKPPRNRPKGLHHYCHPNGTIYYSMLHPETKKRKTLGTDYSIACKVLHQVNAQYKTDIERNLLNNILGNNDTLNAFVEKQYWRDIERRNNSESTVKSKLIMTRQIAETFGNHKLREITTRLISDYIESIVDDGKESQASALRTQFIDLFKVAISSGWLDATHNPAQLTVSPKVTVKRSRLSIDQFRQLHSVAKEGCERNMLELAILTTHAGVAELSTMKKPVDGFLWIERKKTEERVKIPLWITIDELGFSLADTVERCSIRQTDNLLWKYWKEAHRPATETQLSRWFSNILKRSKIDWQGKKPASLYECRSLAIRLHDAQGDIDPQVLAAHKSSGSTDIYRDTRGSEWKEVKKLDTK